MNYVAYYRVSTAKQGQSGLGLAAQQAAVQKHSQGGTILASYQDIESGKNNHRPELTKAIAHAQKAGATLVIAKLDRLSRNVSFIASLMDAKVDFVACDMPTANSFTIHIFAALAQQERELISERTRKALAALKEKGVKLGSPENLTQAARQVGLARRRKNAAEDKEAKHARFVVKQLRKEGYSYRFIAQELTEMGLTTRRGGQYQVEQVRRLASPKH